MRKNNRTYGTAYYIFIVNPERRTTLIKSKLVEVFPIHVTQVYGEVNIWLNPFLTSALARMSGQFHA
jgi:hypothetical protein